MAVSHTLRSTENMEDDEEELFIADLEQDDDDDDIRAGDAVESEAGMDNPAMTAKIKAPPNLQKAALYPNNPAVIKALSTPEL
mmetsp:Transcript_26753/g.39130  ORF Transcript_26753/g.39130 Transcript_26753/m.39130 type:complete len:83 (+) Transcript_26753:1382-1630(+)